MHADISVHRRGIRVVAACAFAAIAWIVILTDYGIKPPKVFLGMFRVRDNITIKFNIFTPDPKTVMAETKYKNPYCADRSDVLFAAVGFPFIRIMKFTSDSSALRTGPFSGRRPVGKFFGEHTTN